MFKSYFINGNEAQKFILKQYFNKLTKLKLHRKEIILKLILKKTKMICAKFGILFTSLLV